MAYNPYPYPGYQPGFYPQSIPEPFGQFRQNQPVQPTQPQNNGILWCQGEEGTKAYLAAPGTPVLIMDSEKNTFYIKSSDQSGMPLPLRIFDYVERTAPNAPPPQQAAPQVDMSNVVTWDKLEEYLSERMKRSFKAAKTKEETPDA